MTKYHVDGKDEGRVMLYTLSTCVWCKKTKALLQELGVGYDYIDVDTLSGEEEDQVVAEIKKHNPACSFPTMIIDGKKCIIGFKESEIREALGSG